jgi:hypothetical protein
MTSITIWTPRRFRLECFEETLRHHYLFRRQTIGPITINYHQDLNGPLIHPICQGIRIRSEEPSIHVILFDDHDLENGLNVEQTITFFKNLVNLSFVFPKVSFVISDFVDYIITDARHSVREIRHLKTELEKIVSQGNSTNIYADHSGDIDGEVCDDDSNITEAGMSVVAELLVEDLSNLPIKQF